MQNIIIKKEKMSKELSYADIRKMRKGVNTVEVYEFPFLEGVEIGIRILTQDEIVRSSIFGRDEAKKNGYEGDPNITLTFTTRKLLQKACTISDTKKPFFGNLEEVGELSADEIDGLFDLYNRTQEKYAPVQSLNTEADFKNLIGEIKKKSLHGMSLSTYTLQKLSYFLIEKYEKSPKDNGSTSGHLKKEKENLKSKQLKTKELKVVDK